MTAYSLRNGLSFDLTWVPQPDLNPRPAKPEMRENDLESVLDCYPFPINDHGEVIQYLQVVNFIANGKLRGASPAVFNQCALRFIQFIKVENFEVEYFGTESDNGFVFWKWTNRLLQRNNDCLVRGDIDFYPFQWDPTWSSHSPPDQLACRLSDTPGASIALMHVNPKTQKKNYLRKFLDKRTFESIIVFVHPDNSFEMLESWRWGFTRSVEVKWKTFTPQIDGPNIITIRKAPTQVSVFGRDDDYSDTLNSRRIANRLSHDAMGNIQSSVDVSYHAFGAGADFLWPDFWQPKP